MSATPAAVAALPHAAASASGAATSAAPAVRSPAAGRGVRFVVPGTPVGKQRARVVRDGRHSYTPAKTVSYERLVRVSALVAGVRVTAAPVALDVLAAWPYPASWSARVRREAEAAWAAGVPRWKDTKPDADNVLKAVSDALEGVAYPHDGRVVVSAPATVWGPRAETIVRVRAPDAADVAWAFDGEAA